MIFLFLCLWQGLVLHSVLFPTHTSCLVLSCFIFSQSHLVFLLFSQVFVYNQNFGSSFKISKMNFSLAICLANISPSTWIDRRFNFSPLVSASIASPSEFFLICISIIYTLLPFLLFSLYWYYIFLAYFLIVKLTSLILIICFLKLLWLSINVTLNIF